MEIYFIDPTSVDGRIAGAEGARKATSPETAADQLAELERAMGALAASKAEVCPPTDDEPSEGANDQLTNEAQ